MSETMTTHGNRSTPEYDSWAHMIQRCTNSNAKDFGCYGARGIHVCQRWLDSFAAFYADMGQRPAAGYTIERKDNNGNYEPDNCCWATRKEQANNRRPRGPTKRKAG